MLNGFDGGSTMITSEFEDASKDVFVDASKDVLVDASEDVFVDTSIDVLVDASKDDFVDLFNNGSTIKTSAVNDASEDVLVDLFNNGSMITTSEVSSVVFADFFVGNGSMMKMSWSTSELNEILDGVSKDVFNDFLLTD
jgi:hypothetical protein